MKYKIKQTDKTKKVIEMHISKEVVSRELDKIYQDISKTASLPGYRVGKAPIELVRKRYRKETTDEAVRTLLADSFKKAVTESDINILGSPAISDLQFDEESGMYLTNYITTPDEWDGFSDKLGFWQHGMEKATVFECEALARTAIIEQAMREAKIRGGG